jgi:tetratricopeptide (TPR) repeat protein
MSGHLQSGDVSLFVGRETELGALLRGLDDARAARGRFVALVGEAGIGKTRTVEEFLARAGLSDDAVLWGRCPEHHALPAYWPWTQAFGRWAERHDAETLATLLGRAASDLAPFVPAIDDRVGRVEPLPPCDAIQARLRLFEALAAVLRRVAERHPVVVVLDDLHWADEGSILLLAFLAPELRRVRSLLVTTYREREMQRMPRLLAEIARVSERIPLRGLAVEDVGAFVRTRTAAALGNGMLAQLHAATRGNPFFLGELVHMLEANGRLDRAEEKLADPLPDEVRQVIRHNLEPLSAEVRRLLTTAAAIGHDFDLARLQAVSDVEPEALLGSLDTAATAGLIEEIRDARGHFRFAHTLIRDALYADIPPLERARLHREIGGALEVLYEGARDAPWAELARHFVNAAVLGDPAKALDYCTRAGEQAVGCQAHEEAAGHFGVALKVARLGRPDEARELALRILLGQTQSFAGDHQRARATFERAAARARALGDRGAFARAALGFAFTTPGIGVVNTTLVALLEEALRMIGNDDSALRAALLGSLASALYFSRDEARRETLSRDAVAMARRVGDPATLARTMVQRHHVRWGSGSVAERLAFCDELIPLAIECGDRRVALHGRLWRIIDLLEAGDLSALDVELETFARESDHTRIPLYRWFAAVVRAMRALVDGRLDDSERLAAEATVLWQEDPLSLSAQTHALQRFLVCLERGRLAEVEEPFTAMARAYEAIPGWQSGLAMIYAASGRAKEARDLLDGFVARGVAGMPHDANFFSSVVSYAQVAHELGAVEAASELYASLEPYADRHIVVGFGAGTYGSCERYLGLLAATLGRLDDAARHLERAVAENVRLGARPLIAHAQWDYANVLALRHERGKAARLREEALETAARLGLTVLRARSAESVHVRASAEPRTTTGVFHRDGAYWTLGYAGATVRMKHASGATYLAMLLQHPGQEIHVLDLTMDRATDAVVIAGAAPEGLVRRHASSDAGEVIDPQARAEYKRRLTELGEELEEARRFNDVGHCERLEAEIEMLTQELSRAVGLGGRMRKAGSAAERARVNVSRAIAAVVKKIAEHHPKLGEHLGARVHTGTFCSYTPDPLMMVHWSF